MGPAKPRPLTEVSGRRARRIRVYALGSSRRQGDSRDICADNSQPYTDAQC